MRSNIIGVMKIVKFSKLFLKIISCIGWVNFHRKTDEHSTAI